MGSDRLCLHPWSWIVRNDIRHLADSSAELRTGSMTGSLEIGSPRLVRLRTQYTR